MHTHVENTPQWGKVLWLRSDTAEVGIALEFGIRVVHLSCPGCENLFYVQPTDLSDGFKTSSGWRLYGGHRIWMAPESDDTYYPDNAPVDWTLLEDGAHITQATDPILGLRKHLTVTFLPDGSIELLQALENVSSETVVGASWGVNTLDAGGVARIPFSDQGRGGYRPHRVVSLWSDTNLHDPRLSFDRTTLTATHMPIEGYCKIGLYCLDGTADFENKGQHLQIRFAAQEMEQYPDNGCNFELYMCSRFMELETLGTKANILPGQTTSHKETWYLTKA